MKLLITLIVTIIIFNLSYMAAITIVYLLFQVAAGFFDQQKRVNNLS